MMYGTSAIEYERLGAGIKGSAEEERLKNLLVAYKAGQQTSRANVVALVIVGTGVLGIGWLLSKLVTPRESPKRGRR